MPRFATLASLLLTFTYSVETQAELADGKLAFNTHCRNCHSLIKGDNRLGPSLYGILGARAGQVQGYRAYSGSLKGFTWDEGILDKFIASPASVAPTTNMNYPPVADPAARKKIIDFIRSTTTR